MGIGEFFREEIEEIHSTGAIALPPSVPMALKLRFNVVRLENVDDSDAISLARSASIPLSLVFHYLFSSF